MPGYKLMVGVNVNYYVEVPLVFHSYADIDTVINLADPKPQYWFAKDVETGETTIVSPAYKEWTEEYESNRKKHNAEQFAKVEKLNSGKRDFAKTYGRIAIIASRRDALFDPEKSRFINCHVSMIMIDNGTKTQQHLLLSDYVSETNSATVRVRRGKFLNDFDLRFDPDSLRLVARDLENLDKWRKAIREGTNE